MTRRLLLLAAAAAVLTVAGCGGGGGGGTSSAATPATSANPAVPTGPGATTPGAGTRTRRVAGLPGGQTIAYSLVLPDRYSASKRWPVLVAFPPGGQGQSEVDALLDRLWEPEARTRGWIVVSPVAPGGSLESDRGNLARLAGIPVAMYVGEDDAGWREPSARTVAELRRLGGRVSPVEGHILTKITGGQLYDVLDATR